jgi:transposase
MGRPSKLTPELQKKIVKLVRDGNYFETAAQAAGIAKSTLYDWLKRGESDEEPFAEFSDALKKAEAEAEADAVAMVRAGLRDAPQWQSAMTFLERRAAERWAKRDPDHGLKTKALELEVETLRAKLKLLEAGQNPDGGGVAFIVPGFVAATKIEGENE